MVHMTVTPVTNARPCPQPRLRAVLSGPTAHALTSGKPKTMCTQLCPIIMRIHVTAIDGCGLQSCIAERVARNASPRFRGAFAMEHTDILAVAAKCKALMGSTGSHLADRVLAYLCKCSELDGTWAGMLQAARTAKATSPGLAPSVYQSNLKDALPLCF
jgi:hypothetical protein